jgi:hypothetical protein
MKWQAVARDRGVAKFCTLAPCALGKVLLALGLRPKSRRTLSKIFALLVPRVVHWPDPTCRKRRPVTWRAECVILPGKPARDLAGGVGVLPGALAGGGAKRAGAIQSIWRCARSTSSGEFHQMRGVLLLPRHGICGLAADSRLPQQGA